MAKNDPSIISASMSGTFIAKNAAVSDNFRIIGGQLSHWDKQASRWIAIVDQQHLAAVCCETYAVNRTLGLTATLSDAVEGRVGRLASGRINADFAKRNLKNVMTPNHLWGFKDGVFDVHRPSEGMRQADKSDYITHFLPYSINPDAELPPELTNVIFSAVEQSDSMVDYMLDLLCYILFDENRFQRFFSWYGIGGAGKGLLTRLVISLLGRNRCYSLDTDALYQGRSDQLVAADGKQLLVLQEADRAMPKAKLKALTGEDVIQVRALYGTPFEFVFQGQFLMVSNPPFPESMVDTGILRRLVPIQFSRAATNPDLSLEPRLLGALGEICGALFSRWSKGVRQWSEWPMPGEVKRDLDFYRFQEDSPKAWLLDNVKKDVDGSLKMSDLLTRYEIEKGELKDKDRERIKKAFQRSIRSDLGVKLKTSREYAASWIEDGDTQTSVDDTQDSVFTEPIDATNLIRDEGAIDMSNKVDYYKSVRNKLPDNQNFLGELWQGNICKEAVLAVRDGKADKATLPAMTPSVLGAETRTDEEAIKKHTGWLCFDVDNIDPVRGKERVMAFKWVAAAWESPRGNGIKFLVRMHKAPSTIKQHKKVYEDICNAMATIAINCDKSCSNPSRLCFLSYDQVPMLQSHILHYHPAIGSREIDENFPLDGPWPKGQRHSMLIKCAAHYWQTTNAEHWGHIKSRLQQTFEWEKKARLDENAALAKEFEKAIESAQRKFPKPQKG